MSHKIFVVSDTHFGHTNILKFTKNDGSLLREFSSVEAMDEHMVSCWNKVVRPQDKVYHLGDVMISQKSFPILARLSGHKRLVRGNHDVYSTAKYSEYFEEIYGCRVFPAKECILSHIPIHPECMSRWKYNVHGHLHGNIMNDKRYVSVCVEQIDYTPIELDELLARQ